MEQRWSFFMRRTRKFAALALLILGILVSGCGPHPAAVTWNFLVYLDGDNNLESFAIDDFNEMEQVGSSANVNILVLLDLYSSLGTKLYKITRDSNTSRISSTVLISSTWDGSERDMSDPATLRNFIIYCQQNYPAGHTVLTLWNHGSGVWPRIAQSGGAGPPAPPPQAPRRGVTTNPPPH